MMLDTYLLWKVEKSLTCVSSSDWETYDGLAMNDDKDQSLSQLFDNALGLHNDIGESSEDTNSENFQDKVKKGILMLEDATRLVSVLDIFSRNENFKEIQTECLKYFLLPVLLGTFILEPCLDLNFSFRWS